MNEPAENLDTGTSEGTVETLITDDGGAWRDTLAGGNTEVLESLKGYESPDKFLEEFNTLKNRDWRDEMAGDDTKFRVQLDRFKAPGEFANSYREAQQKISSGELNKQGFPQPPENATEDDIKAFREQLGIPEKPEGYYENLPDNLVIGEDDRAYFDDFAKSLHDKNMPPEAAHAAVEWYNNFREQEQEALINMDREQHQEMEDALRQDWGTGYRANINLATALIKKTFGDEGAEAFMNARGPDGRGVLNNRAIMEGWANLARQTNPLDELTSTGGDAQKTLTDEIASLETYMKEERSKYNKDVPAQERLRYLYDLQLKAGK